MKVLILNGPNLDMLGRREVNFYGSNTYEELTEKIAQFASQVGLEVDIRQTNDEATMISWLHEAAESKLPVIINPAAFTHYSYAIRDAIVMVESAKIEVHLSNPLSREEFRHTSVVSGVVDGTISGFGANSYRLAL
ncbi:MAG: type II 3-dehydroquinate dehydratase, partial [Actinomycetales bacterium]